MNLIICPTGDLSVIDIWISVSIIHILEPR